MHQKSVLDVQSCCFANETHCLFEDVLIAVAVVTAYARYYSPKIKRDWESQTVAKHRTMFTWILLT